jgi:apolipoprotein N-acyltransferase
LARAVGSIGAGVALIFAFPPFGLWFMALVTPAALAVITRGRSMKASALYGLLAGLAFFVPFLKWTGAEVGAVPWLALAVVQALYFIPLAIGLTLVQRFPGWPVWTAAVWVADEALRGRTPYGGFPWGKLAFSQADGPFLGLAQLGGAPFLTFAVALTGGLLAWAVVTPRRTLRVAAVAGAVGVTVSGLAVQAPAANGETVRMAMIQGNVAEPGLDFNSEKRVVTENHANTTLDLADAVAAGDEPQPDFVIWPENSSDVDPYSDRETYEVIDESVRAIGVPTMIGAIVPTADEQNVKNTSIVWDPQTGPGDTYVKRHPLPFGEYIPMRSIAERITDAVERQPRDHLAGDKVGLLDMAGTPVGNVICYEVAFDNLVRDTVTAGGQVLSVQSNNATFGYSPMSEQQLAMSQIRAVEHSRTVLVSTTSGISALVTADGAIAQQTELFTHDIITADIELSTATTLATRVGEWPEWLLTIAAVVVMGLAISQTRVRRREDAEPPTDEPEPIPAEVG